MNPLDIVRAWKDPAYRESLSPEEQALVPSHPAGLIELTDEKLKAATGVSGVPPTTRITCTEFTSGLRRCCPR